ncbi:zinc-ribbon domain-containing protein [Apilactobacillus sp. M161]|uniref:Zinc-ribbon domain-containing protein n=1 Tax=Apilactobacillus xinyiensis TaxID=2841032 RepID=A0ABT0I1F2_9LACO|nr:zinc-ribbon domain-containing protein [Apilactobacillus xinyiensis]MCK8624552.1 zinc-ribbon domain-containing protein [Apilactobacillus xinyiensis]
MNKFFCPNCGKEINKDIQFCPNCGFNVTQYLNKKPKANSQSNVKSNSSTVNNNANVYRQSPQPKKNVKAWPIITGVVVIILLAAAYIWGNHYYSKAATMDRIVNSLKTDNNLTTYFYSKDPNLSMSQTTLDPLAKYMNDNKQELNEFNSQLNSYDETDNKLFKLVQTGHNFLIFPKYQVRVKSLYPEVSTNRSNVIIKINNNKVATSDSSEFSKKVGPLVPGEYTFNATGKVNGKSLTNESKQNVTSNDDAIDLQLQTIQFKVNTAPNSDVYVNDKKVGKAGSDGSLSIPEMPYSSNMEVQAVYHGQKGKVTSDPTKVTLADKDSDVNVSFPGAISEDDANNLLNNLYDSISDLSNDDDTDSNDLADYYENGSNNSSFNDMNNLCKTFAKNKDLNSVSYEPKLVSTTPDSDNTSLITYKVKYEFDSDEKEHFQTFMWRATVKKIDNDYKIVKAIADKNPISDTESSN